MSGAERAARVGAEFAGHRIEAVIGEGGMGVVYRARNLALDRLRALKVLAPALSPTPAFASASAASRGWRPRSSTPT